MQKSLFFSVTSAKTDRLILLGFVLIALLYHLCAWRGRTPYVFLDSDGANIAGFAAALDHPELFKGDEVLEDRDNFRFYMAFHIPLIRFINRFTHGYGSAFLSLLGLHVFVQALGFYLLGMVVFKHRLWAALLAVSSLANIQLNLGEFWGIIETPLPRFTFQAFLPYLLAGAYYWRSQPAARPWLMIITGVLVYIHPPSAPVWGFVLWFGFWFFQPHTWSLKKRIMAMFALGALFLLAAAPFIINYLTSHTHVTTPEYQQIYAIMESRFISGYLDIPRAFLDFLKLIMKQKAVMIFAVLSPILVLKLWPESRNGLRLFGAWLLGILIISVLVPWAEQSIARINRTIPLEIDFIRGIRYIVPVALIFFLWALAAIFRNIKKSWWVVLMSITLVLNYAVKNTFSQVRTNEVLARLYRGEIFLIQKREQEIIDALNAICRLTPAGSRILPMDLGLQIRYYAMRPVVYDWKDGGALSYTNHEGLLAWYEKNRQINSLRDIDDHQEKLKRLTYFGKEWGADYLLIDFKITPSDVKSLNMKLIYLGSKYALLEFPPVK